MRLKSCIRRCIFVFPLLLAGLAGCSDVNWQHDPQSALNKAAQTRQRALMMFVGGFDQAATKMDTEVFADKNVQALMREFVAIRVDTMFHKQLVQKYGVQQTPAFVVVRPDMSISGKQEGGMTTDQFRTFLIRNRLK